MRSHYNFHNLNSNKMKHFIMVICAITAFTFGHAQDAAVSTSSANIGSSTAAFSWAETSYDFGKTKVGIPVSYEFRFTNTGMVPLIITSVKASCGCTLTAYTKDPVSKDASGFVRATYNAAKAGKLNKTVAVYANTGEGVIQLTVKGEIIE
jgi:hypothetical protein